MGFLGKKFLLAQGVQLFVAVSTVPRRTLGGAYRRTYLHLYARYRGLVGGVRAVFAVLSQLLGAAKKNHLGGYGPGRMRSLPCTHVSFVCRRITSEYRGARKMTSAPMARAHRVQRARRLVEEQDGRLADHRARDGDALLLPT
jgi:hypothetical protein